MTFDPSALPPMPAPAEVDALLTVARAGDEANLAPLAPVSRRINAANAWVPVWSTDQIPTRIALIHTEFKEARDELRAADPCVQAEKDELADIIIRCLDTVELMLPEWLTGRVQLLPLYATPRDSAATRQDQLTWLADIRDRVDEGMQLYRKTLDDDEMNLKVASELAHAAQRVAGLLVARGDDPVACVVHILHKSRTRGPRHGGRRV
ncbi:hypothetical protein [Deinococcus wulumuqiensis]|uniref:hypothetical protein n=1 Tax=Deinococcus wulumuqiensis TaxID=980427 RepID=UPI00242C3EA5|nr:hypothetical protein [Deinococcus wulumuqiensis]